MDNAGKKAKELQAEILRLRSSVNELKILNEIAVEAGKSADIDEMLNMILHKCICGVNAEQGSVSLISESKTDSFKTFMRRDDLSNLKHNYHIGSNITGWVLLNKQPLIIENLKKDKRFSASAEELRDIKSVMCVPIWHGGGIIGIIQMLNKKDCPAFSRDDLTLLSIISVQVGQMIKNLELRKDAYEKRKEAEIARIESEKLLELDRAKSDFFANITHEFRTPLTLILGPAKKMLEQLHDGENQKECGRIIKNSERLLSLINQILDLSKLESGIEKLSVKKENVSAFTASVVRKFYPAAEIGNIELRYLPDPENIISYFDPDKLEKIITNLLSNAFKFTQPGGKVTVELSTENQDWIKLTVSDTGVGIPSNRLEKIFKRFYRVEKLNEKTNEGTGIGLALVKELVEIHHGTVSVESRENVGSVFTVRLPRNNFEEEEIINGKMKENSGGECAEESNESIKNSKPIVLVVEDNKEVREYIVETLSADFSIIEAENGSEGWEKALKTIPDLIISDVCMPGMDGNDFCRRLKLDEKTSHIPVILLTALSGEKNKLEGLETGADDYILKPFEPKELLTRINNLITQRRNLRKKFSGQITLQPKDVAVTSADERFLKKLMEIIDKEISNPDLNVSELSKKLYMSRVQLFRKLKALTDQSVVDFIRSMRLKRALKLLENKSGNISEIAYDVGFNNPAYFSECFRKQFGKLPSEYVFSSK